MNMCLFCKSSFRLFVYKLCPIKIYKLDQFKPNAGMPVIDEKGNAVYSMNAEEFAHHMKVLIENGASVVGGCCGTTPSFIKALHDTIR